MRKVLAGMLGLVMGSGVAVAQGGVGVMGVWRDPGGAKIEIHTCGTNLCAKLVKLSEDAGGTNDGNNPDKSLRQRQLVGLEIGTGFHLTDSTHAEDGKLYDPKSGKTYHGSMESDGDSLKLRGYVGMKAFGRTEIWTRDTTAK